MKEKINELKWRFENWVYPRRFKLIIISICILALFIIAISVGNWFTRNEIYKAKYQEEITKIEEYEPIKEEKEKEIYPVLVETSLADKDQYEKDFYIAKYNTFDLERYNYKLACYDKDKYLIAIYDADIQFSGLKYRTKFSIDAKSKEDYESLKTKTMDMALLEISKVVRTSEYVINDTDNPMDGMKIVDITSFSWLTE